jgi:cytochrome c oxidase cbb3-type subunit 4
MDIGTIRGLLTALLLILFLGIVIWSFSRKRKGEFERAAKLPLEDDSKPPAADDGKEKHDE